MLGDHFDVTCVDKLDILWPYNKSIYKAHHVFSYLCKTYILNIIVKAKRYISNLERQNLGFHFQVQMTVFIYHPYSVTWSSIDWKKQALCFFLPPPNISSISPINTVRNQMSYFIIVYVYFRKVYVSPRPCFTAGPFFDRFLATQY